MAETPDAENEQPESDENQTEESSPAQPFNVGTIVETSIDAELRDSYLTYAMSTIMDRALPDVRDGLKPSQRRILVALNDLRAYPGSKHFKCAKVAGDTSGNYHPHGESVIYPTLVNLAQPWKTRYPLVDSQGNFGSIDGDPPAAMRYTEARMAHPAREMLEDLKQDTVDLQENYDGRLMEPTVLPSKFPNLLVNGGTGIAVGMATSLPPHNLGEICDAIVTVIDQPEIDLMGLMEIVPGPDFPTGGTICGRAGILDGYTSGRGKLIVRGKTHFEEQKNGKTLIVISEIPYQILKTTIIDQIVDAVKNEKIKDIADVNDFSGRAGMRLVVETKKNADPDVVLNQLYRYSSLQTTFSVMNIALVNHQPRTLSLKEMIQLFIEHRKDVITRRTKFLLRKAQQEAHLKEGLIYAVCDIDEVIRLIRSSRTRDEAIQKLMDRGFRIPLDHPYAPKIPQRFLDASTEEDGVSLSRAQAEAIGRMQLISLTGLEIEKLVDEYRALIEEIEGYELILSSEQRLLDIIREDTLEIKEKYADPRRTEISHEELGDIDISSLIPEHEVIVTVSHEGYIKRLPVETYRTQSRGGRGVIGADTKDDDFTEHLFVCSSHSDLLCFTDTGRCFLKKVYEIPEATRTHRGRAIINVLELKDDEKVRAFLPIEDFERHSDFLVFATRSGLVKRTSLKLYQNVNRSGIIALNLKDGDHLVDVRLTSGQDHLLFCTRQGMSIRFNENDARAMGRTATGVRAINLAADDEVVAMVKAEDDRQLLTVCEKGVGKRTPMIEYLVQSENGETRAQSRGGKGRRDIKVTDKNGFVVAAMSVTDENEMMLISEGGMIVRSRVSEVRQSSRNTVGVRVINLKDGDRLVAVARIDEMPEVVEGDAPVDGDTSSDTGPVGSEAEANAEYPTTPEAPEAPEAQGTSEDTDDSASPEA